jgi:hypothetical protein
MLQSEEEKETNSRASAVGIQPPIAPHSDTLKLKTSNDSATQTSWSDDGLFKIPQVCSHDDTHTVLGNGAGSDAAFIRN